MRRIPALRDHLEETTAYYRNQLTEAGFDIIPGVHPIVPVMLYDERLAGEYAKRMMEKGVYVVAFSYPVVPKGKARIRTQVCATHTKEDIDYIVKCFKEVRDELKSKLNSNRALKNTLPFVYNEIMQNLADFRLGTGAGILQEPRLSAGSPHDFYNGRESFYEWKKEMLQAVC